MIIYCDGSCRGNGKENSEGGFGVVAYTNDGKFVEAYGEQKQRTTNNEQEILAILYAYKRYGKQLSLDTDFTLGEEPIVYSDSSYCVNTFTNWMFSWAKNNWVKGDKTVPKNLELIKEYYNLYKDGYRIDLRLIKGHSGIEGNELADKLATGVIKAEDIMKQQVDFY